MHLSDRPRGKRLRIELPEQLLHRASQLALDERPGDPGRVGRHMGLQVLELARHVETDQVGTQAEHLPEFDPGRAELAQRAPQPLAARHPQDFVVNPPFQQGRRDLRDPLSVIRQPREAVAPEHARNLVESFVLANERARQVIHAGGPASYIATTQVTGADSSGDGSTA